jgi:hypothetical protein
MSVIVLNVMAPADVLLPRAHNIDAQTREALVKGKAQYG